MTIPLTKEQAKIPRIPKKNDKEKSIKPEDKSLDGLYWLIMIRDWLARLVPNCKVHEYVQVEFHADPGWEGDPLRKVSKITVKFFTHYYEYTMEFNEKRIMRVSALSRKAHAGSDTYSGTDIVDSCPLTDEMLGNVVRQILAWELVKIFKDDRQEERFEKWQFLSSHYTADEKEMYHEWEQKGKEIRNQRVFERVK